MNDLAEKGYQSFILEQVIHARRILSERKKLEERFVKTSWLAVAKNWDSPEPWTPDSFIKRMAGGLFYIGHGAGRKTWYAKTKTGILYRYNSMWRKWSKVPVE
jgi:hypothetical protein